MKEETIKGQYITIEGETRRTALKRFAHVWADVLKENKIPVRAYDIHEAMTGIPECFANEKRVTYEADELTYYREGEGWRIFAQYVKDETKFHRFYTFIAKEGKL